ncbi:MAG TPA: UDP-N-acetylmuramate dehydrogenase [Candidatus Dormibacteraeota bacterium]
MLLSAEIPGAVRDHPLAKHTSFNIGGSADWFLETGDLESVTRLGVPFRVIGAGTNLLVSDAGVEGLVVRCVSRSHEVRGTRIWAEAGLKMMRLARIAADHNLTGFEWAIGVPGAVAGAVYQNAGCWGRELKDVLVEADGLTPDGKRVTWTPADLELGYRRSALRHGALRGHVVTGMVIQLERGDGAASRARMAELTAERERTQPIKTKNCGSVFINPDGDSAGRLVEAAGLKGAEEGAAQISPVHANFIVNRGGARAADVWKLIERAQAAVRGQFGVELEIEVERLGRW